MCWSAELCARETDERRASVSRSTSCLSRPPSHWYLFETCHFPEPSQCASLDHQLLPSQFDSGDSSISGPSNFVLFSFFHFIRRFCKKDKQANSSKLFNSRQTRAQYFASDRHYCRKTFLQDSCCSDCNHQRLDCLKFLFDKKLSRTACALDCLCISCAGSSLD